MTAKKTKRVTSQFARYIGPVMGAIAELGGSGRPDEVRAVIARQLKMSEAEQSEPLPSGVQTRFENQVHWARFYLAKAGYIDSSQRGVWTLTEKGRQLGEVTDDDIQAIVKDVNAQVRGAADEEVDDLPHRSSTSRVPRESPDGHHTSNIKERRLFCTLNLCTATGLILGFLLTSGARRGLPAWVLLTAPPEACRGASALPPL